jgi:hypothetical protein
MQSLKRIVAMKPMEVPHFQLDRFQESVLANLYLEFFFEACRVLIAPDLSYLVTGEADPEETRELDELLDRHYEDLMIWRRYIMVNLALFSSLLETNSYYLAVTHNLLISRFVEVPGRSDEFVLKLYTIDRADLPARYKDKIYLGRDHINMQSMRRSHFGLLNIREEIGEQLAKLRERLLRLVPEIETELFRREYLADLEETVDEFGRATDAFVHSFPGDTFTHNVEVPRLLDASTGFRNLKHILVELEDTLREMERTLLQEGHPKGAAYVIKWRRDITNAINFIMCKVNGRISNVVNRVDALAWFETGAGVGG